jgi:bifunctional non-homologous end joining protein LigD
MKPRQSRHGFMLKTIAGACEAPFPTFIEPCKPTLRPKLPEGANWIYEIKFDGYRAQLHKRGNNVKIYTSSGLDWSDKFATLCDAARGLSASDLVIDGEIVAPNDRGVPDFHALLAAIGRDPGWLLFYAFDVLHLDGIDMRGAILGQRRRVLERLVPVPARGPIVLSETIGEGAEEVFRHACEMGLEGIVAKRADLLYRSGRVEGWIKAKCTKLMELAIVGFVPAKGRSIAALRLARREGERLVYVGKVGTGFTQKTAQSVRERLEPLVRKTPALAKPLRKKDTVWVEPKVSARVQLLELTEDGQVRAGSFKGLVP